MSLPKVNHRMLRNFVHLSCATKRPLLIVGAPAVGKTVSTFQYSEEYGYDMILSHPVISDPSDFKGLGAKSRRKVLKPSELDELERMLADKEEDEWTMEDIAIFLPFGDLLRAIEADRPTIWFFDDFGQAPMAVQAACMQIIGQRMIAGHKISDHVRIIAATNRREDKAGVKGLLSPVKSRFGMKVELVATLEDTVAYFYKQGIYQPIIDFIQSHKDALHDDTPDNTMESGPSPRTWEYLSQMIQETQDTEMQQVLSEYNDKKNPFLKQLCSSCIGQAWGEQFYVHLSIYDRIPRYEDIISEPEDFPMDHPIDVRFAILSMLATQGKARHSKEIFTYVTKLAKTYQLIFIRAIVATGSPLKDSREAQLWITTNMDLYMD